MESELRLAAACTSFILRKPDLATPNFELGGRLQAVREMGWRKQQPPCSANQHTPLLRLTNAPMLLQAFHSRRHRVPISVAPAFGYSLVHQVFSSSHTWDTGLASGGL